jgi:hypothetical protein
MTIMMAPPAPPKEPPTKAVGGGNNNHEPDKPVNRTPWGKICLVTLVALVLFITIAVWLGNHVVQ